MLVPASSDRSLVKTPTVYALKFLWCMPWQTGDRISNMKTASAAPQISTLKKQRATGDSELLADFLGRACPGAKPWPWPMA